MCVEMPEYPLAEIKKIAIQLASTLPMEDPLTCRAILHELKQLIDWQQGSEPQATVGAWSRPALLS